MRRIRHKSSVSSGINRRIGNGVVREGIGPKSARTRCAAGDSTARELKQREMDYVARVWLD
jgi:hypothetical protein